MSPSTPQAGIERVSEAMKNSIPKVEWDFEKIHYFDNGPLTAQYLFVLDAFNFCFWPDKDMSYEYLASGLKEAFENDKSAFDVDRLQKCTGPQLRKMLKWPRPLPLEDERVRLMHEVGLELENVLKERHQNLLNLVESQPENLLQSLHARFSCLKELKHLLRIYGVP